VKSLLANILLAQSICISYSDFCSLTPFKFINSQINIPDCKGKESLFQAEMNRCKYSIDKIASLKDSEHCFIAMDEILSSTNPVEGIAGSYAILKKMSGYKNSVMVCTTHYNYLTKLAKDNRFSNYRVKVEETEEKIHYTYKLEKGVSKQYIALRLLKDNGFDTDIISTAEELKQKFI
jgi:DNA mismatch repair ATPase MutS